MGKICGECFWVNITSLPNRLRSNAFSPCLHYESFLPLWAIGLKRFIRGKWERPIICLPQVLKGGLLTSTFVCLKYRCHKLSRGKDANRFMLCQSQQVLITRHDVFSLALNCAGNYGVIIRIIGNNSFNRFAFN